MDVLDFAMQTELDNKAFYERLAAETSIDGVKKVFSILAAEELKHFRLVQALKATEVRELADSALLESAKGIFRTLQIDEGLRRELRTKLDAYRLAIETEAESIRFYEDVARRETNPEAARVLLKIVDEERKHYNVVKNIHDFIAGHQDFMVWHKFGKTL